MTKEFKHIGKATQKFDGKERVSGKAVYGHDLELPGMLYAAILRTRYPCAEILSINTSKAKALEGVECVLTAEDADVHNISYKRDHPILKKGRVNCIRDEIVAVAARSKEIAEEAIRLIEVEYRVKKGVYDPFEALLDTAPIINEFGKGLESFDNKNIAEAFHYEHGDLEAEKARSKVIVKKRYELPRVTHACMATSNITADYSPLTGRLTLWASTQVPFLYLRDMAHALKMAPSNIRVVQPVIGGGFGSKLDMLPFEPICALLAIKTAKPVQLLYSREEEFLASPTRQPMVIDLTTGADEQGKFTFRAVEIIMDNGAYTSWGATTPFVMMQTFSSLYQVPACRFDARAVYTNNPFAGSFRGYGNPQATFALESNIDLMAEALGMDKAEIRLLNANYPGEITGQGLHYNTCGAIPALKAVVEKGRYHAIAHAPKEGRYKRGIGLASMLHVGGGAKIYRSDGCGTTLKLDDYGYLTIITGSNEIGQGSETVLAMIAMEELGIEQDKIKIINTDTDVKPWDVGVHASRTSFVAGNSLLGAISLLKEKLNKKAAELLHIEGPDFVYENGMIRVDAHEIKIDKVVRDIHFMPPHQLCEVSFFYEPSSEFQDKQFKGDVSGSYAFASQAIEVEVDTLTGAVRVLEVHVSQDVGRVLNPLGLQGQIEGGVATGIGYALTEEMIYEDGLLKNPSFHGYKLLTANDMPKVHFYPIETNDGAGPYGAKGASEAPLIPTSAAIANAVANAIGVRFYSLPLTAEKVLFALVQKSVGTPRRCATLSEHAQIEKQKGHGF
ncbi:MAG: xanthine dehydrogenase family protein molybdopterin-binding subunit [Saprospiraceae bacterium]|nr:xanthine dehydrogenase family protein molybdopterin-binding subunit [Saprospiraceae bacterium]